MKTGKKIFAGILLCVCVILNAQKKDSLVYGGMQQFSPSFGENEARAAFTIINGIRYQRIFVGIGADYLFTARYNSYSPAVAAVFLDGRYYLNKRKKLFVKGDAGVNLIAGPSFGWGGYNSEVTKKPGYYWGTGIGFKARISKELSYVFDVSYVVRQTRYDFKYQDWRLPEQWFTEKRNNIKPMIVVNMGLEIF